MRCIALTALCAGCLGAGTTVCDNGAICPDDLVCTGLTKPVCAKQEDLDVCKGVPDRTGCSTAFQLVGSCANQFCDECRPEWIECRYGEWMPMQAPTGEQLNAIWARATDDVFVVGNGGTVLRYDGTEWRPFATGAMLGLSGIWGTSESDLFISSDTQQGVYHFDGTTSVLASTGRFMRGVWGAASNDVFAVGSQGAVYRFTGTWSMMSNGSATLNAVSGSSNMHVLAAGNEVIELFDGAMWQETAMTGLTLHSISTSPTGNALAAGRDDTNAVSIILVQEGASWNRFNAVGIDTLYGVWAKSDNDAYSVGDNGYIAHFNGTWTQMSSPTTNQLRAVAGIDNEVFAVGAGGVILRLSPK